MIDLSIENGLIIDGTNKKPYHTNIYIVKDKIVELTNLKLKNVKTRINAHGLVVSPGFIDIHSHADLNIFSSPSEDPKLHQGITTEVVGNCGISIFPLHRERNSWFKTWEGILGKRKYPSRKPAIDFKEYYKTIKRKKVVQNVFALVGYGTLRYNIKGFRNKPLTKDELNEIKREIERNLSEGAVGVSFGFVYPPCSYADENELIEIFKIVKKYDGYISVHLRNEGDYVIEALTEVIELAKRTLTRLHISHMKAYGKRNHNKVEKMLQIIEKENKNIEVTFDIYPYIAGSTTISALIPPAIKTEPHWTKKILAKRFQQKLLDAMHDMPENYINEMGYDNIVISNLNKNKNYIGKSIHQIAENNRKGDFQTLCEILHEEKGQGEILLFGISEENLEMLLKSKYSIIGSDALHGEHPHPRTYGAFPRIISEYVKKKKILNLEEAIAKMTSKPAEKIKKKNIGLI